MPSSESASLERRLGPFDAAAIIVANVIGGGILFFPPGIAANTPNTWVFLSTWVAGGLLAFTFSLDNVIISQFVSVAGNTTFPVFVFSAVRSVLRPDLAAAATIVLGLTLLALLVVVLVLRRSGESSSDITATLTGAGG